MDQKNGICKLFFFLHFWLYLGTGCQPQSPIDWSKGQLHFEKIDKDKLPQETQKMVEILHEAAMNAVADKYYFLSSERVKAYQVVEDSVYGENKIQYLFNFATELVYSGNYEEARKKLGQLMEFLNYDESDISTENRPIHILIALSHIFEALEKVGEEKLWDAFHLNADHSFEGSSKTDIQKSLEIFEKLHLSFNEDLYLEWMIQLISSLEGKHAPLPPDLSKGQNQIELHFNNESTRKGLIGKGLIGGISMEDFNRDGNLDIIHGSIGFDSPLYYFEGNKDGTFSYKSKEAQLEGLIGGISIIHGDFNNDGFSDVFVSRGGTLSASGNQPNSLLKNNGDGTFTDVTSSAGILDFFPSNHAHFVDFNNDGYLDIFVANESLTKYFRNAHPSRLYENKGDGTFEEVSVKYGLSVSELVMGSAWLDVNNDGLLDLYLSIEGASNRLFLNNGTLKDEGEIWSFEEVPDAAGASDPVFSNKCVAVDVNQDGFEDLLVFPKVQQTSLAYYANHLNQNAHDYASPRLFINDGEGRFEDQSSLWGLNYNLMGQGVGVGDLDNNGYPDFYVGTGSSNIETMVPNVILQNSGVNLKPNNHAGSVGFLGNSYSILFADTDQDGKLDILATKGGYFGFEKHAPVILKNETENNYAWVQVRLQGKSANYQGIGAKIEIITQSEDGSINKQHQRVCTQSTPAIAHFGLGDATAITEIIVRWPDKYHSVQSVKNPKINAMNTIIQEVK
jgi:tetratricopeptide (TPR) repeat protein